MKKSLRVAIVAGALALLPVLTLAAVPPGPTATPAGFTSAQDIVSLLNVVVQWLFYLLLILAVLMLIWAAFLYLTAGGDEEKVGKAKNVILGAVIALVIAFVASGIPRLVGGFLGQ